MKNQLGRRRGGGVKVKGRPEEFNLAVISQIQNLMSHFASVFIVDDDEITRFLLTAKLENHGFADHYQSFDSAKEALTFLQDHKEEAQELPDLIFLDINMPEMNCWEFLESYETIATAFPKKIYLCILTSSVYEKDMERARVHPRVDEYLIKPVQEDALDALVDKYAPKH